MSDAPVYRSPLAELAQKFCAAVSDSAERCSTDAELLDVVGLVLEVDTHLARSLAVAIIAREHGGTVPPGAYSVQLKAAQVLDAAEPNKTFKLDQLLRLQNAAGYAAAESFERLPRP
ncbi:hypothetical protein AB0L75_41860 [Streptomyces sp. NPDC052101]|uniref:hypothetical protein n=1 Tax=Streptomyces sp. NPDC052101 TaxID=3155763 RepID=UPI003428EB70